MFRRGIGELKAEISGNGLVLTQPFAHCTALVWLGIYIQLGVYE